MEVQLRPPKHRFHPLMRRGGMGYTDPPDCTPTIPGAIPSPGCIAQLLAVQQANMVEHDEGQRQTFIDNCNRDWATNDAQYAALGLPRPANQCEAMYPAGGGGAAAPVQIQPVYMAPSAPAPAAVSSGTVAVPAKATGITVTTPTSPAPGSDAAALASPIGAAQQAAAVADDLSLHPFETVPVWAWALGAAAILYFMTKGK